MIANLDICKYQPSCIPNLAHIHIAKTLNDAPTMQHVSYKCHKALRFRNFVLGVCVPQSYIWGIAAYEFDQIRFYILLIWIRNHHFINRVQGT